MSERGGQRRGELAFHGQCQRLDMAPFALGRVVRSKPTRGCGLLSRRFALLVEGVDAGQRDAGQREVRIGRDRPNIELK